MADAPAFDPTKPFEEAGAPAFDPSKPFEAVAAPQDQAPMSWSDVGKSAVTNIPHSAVEFGKNIAQPFMHPVETGKALLNLNRGLMDYAGDIPGGKAALSSALPTLSAATQLLDAGTNEPKEDHRKYVNALGSFFADRYGGMENFKRTLAHDPVGFAGDVATVLTGGETALARAPGILGKVGEIAGTAGRVVDPLSVVTGAAKGAGYAGSEFIGHLGTGTGSEALRGAYTAGKEGGDAAQAFRDNMRGVEPATETVNAARQAVTNMKVERGKAYRDQMDVLRQDTTPLNFDGIDRALDDIKNVKSFKGQSLSPSTEAIRLELEQAVNDWRTLDPKEFHTAEGFDALKQKIGDIRDATQYGSPERLVADKTYQAVRKTIVDQNPQYAKIMKGYEEASGLIKEIEQTLSVSPNARVDTTLRKLQSVLRNNVTTAYGRRAELADYLVNAGAPHLMERLSGQALQPWFPRGLQRVGMQLSVEAGLAGFGIGAAHALPAVAATLPFMSPRLMGEAYHGAGRMAASPVIRPAAQAAFQEGRALSDKQQKNGGAVGAKHGFARGGHVSREGMGAKAWSQRPPLHGARKARDGQWYVRDAHRPGKYMRIDMKS